VDHHEARCQEQEAVDHWSREFGAAAECAEAVGPPAGTHDVPPLARLLGRGIPLGAITLVHPVAWRSVQAAVLSSPRPSALSGVAWSARKLPGASTAPGLPGPSQA
jgi:hypothetical protein